MPVEPKLVDLEGLEVQIEGAYLRVDCTLGEAPTDPHLIPLCELVAAFIHHQWQVVETDPTDAQRVAENALAELFQASALFRFFAEHCEEAGQTLAKGRWGGAVRKSPISLQPEAKGAWPSRGSQAGVSICPLHDDPRRRDRPQN